MLKNTHTLDICHVSKLKNIWVPTLRYKKLAFKERHSTYRMGSITKLPKNLILFQYLLPCRLLTKCGLRLSNTINFCGVTWLKTRLRCIIITLQRRAKPYKAMPSNTNGINCIFTSINWRWEISTFNLNCKASIYIKTEAR